MDNNYDIKMDRLINNLVDETWYNADYTIICTSMELLKALIAKSNSFPEKAGSLQAWNKTLNEIVEKLEYAKVNWFSITDRQTPLEEAQKALAVLISYLGVLWD